MYHVTDTHSLVWYLTEDKKLSKSALSIFTKADNGDTIIIVPTIVLAEIIHICEKKKKNLEIKNVMDMLKNFRKIFGTPEIFKENFLVK